jgi:hypothetical protein
LALGLLFFQKQIGLPGGEKDRKRGFKGSSEKKKD